MTTLPIPRVWATPTDIPGSSYRPSNGTEGRNFEDWFCSTCSHDHAAHLGDLENGCPIFARALGSHIGDPGYPAEWVIADDGYPTCTAFEPDGCTSHFDTAG